MSDSDFLKIDKKQITRKPDLNSTNPFVPNKTVFNKSKMQSSHLYLNGEGYRQSDAKPLQEQLSNIDFDKFIGNFNIIQIGTDFNASRIQVASEEFKTENNTNHSSR